MSRRVAFISSFVDHAPQYQWIAERVRKDAVKLHFLLLNPGPSHIGEYLANHGYPVETILVRRKRDYLAAILTIRRYLREHQIDVVITQFQPAALIGMCAAVLAGIKRRVQFRRHGIQNHLLGHHAVWYDRTANRLSSQIVVPSRSLARALDRFEHVQPKKIKVIHHGFDFEAFSNVRVKDVEALREKYDVRNAAPVIGVSARYELEKGYGVLIPAFKIILSSHPKAVLVVANSRGRDKAIIRKLLGELPAGSYREIEFEPDFASLYGLFDVMVHVPTHPLYESFGKIYVEALAARIPSVFTLSGIAHEFIRHGENAWVVPHGEMMATASGIQTLLEDRKLRAALADSGYSSVVERFPLGKMIEEIEALCITP